MIGRGGRGLAAAALLAIALVAAQGHPAAARAEAASWTNGACPTAQDVTVVVDFQELRTESGATPANLVRCTAGSPSTGFDALAKAGISVQPVTNQPFICKIEGLPYNASCGSIPRGGYWSYWVAARGGAWCYSQLGAGGRTPKPGTVEGWSFSSGSAEGRTPPRTAVPPKISGSPSSIDDGSCPSPPTTTTTTTKAAPGTTAPPSGGTAPPDATVPSRGHTSGGSPTTAPAGAVATTAPPGTDTTGSTSSTSTSSTSTTAAAGGEVRIRDDDSGSPAGAIAGGAAIAGLGLAAALTARRRRRAADPGLGP